MKHRLVGWGFALVGFWLAISVQGSPWQADRQGRFERWQAVHANWPDTLESFVAATRRLVGNASAALGAIEDVAVIWRVEGAPAELWDAPEAPEMVIIPAGEFSMGTPPGVPSTRGSLPYHRVRIGYPLAVGKYPVTKGEFSAFVLASGYDATHGRCWAFDEGKGHDQIEQIEGVSWATPGFQQGLDEPAVCISQQDANAYVAWLRKGTGHVYRLLSEAEWEFAARAGSATARPWGPEPSHEYANYGEGGPNGCCRSAKLGRDQWEYTSPVGSFPPNAFGLYDMLGNVWQRLQDCWHTSYKGAPVDGAAWTSGDCSERSLRGASWGHSGEVMSSSRRGRNDPAYRVITDGFRVARELW